MAAPKLSQNLAPGDRLSLTGERVLEVEVGPQVRVETERQTKWFEFAQVVYLKS